MNTTNIREKFSTLHIENRPFINGVHVKPANGRMLEKTCPADGTTIPSICICDSEDVDQAVQQAAKAYRLGHWSRKSTAEKKAILFELAKLMEEDIATLAYLDTLETGRPYGNFVEDSIPKAIGALRWFTESIDKLYEHYISNARSSLSFITHEPLGVVGIITPWNDPLVIALWKITPALLMGNSVIVKPAEQSSFSTLRLAGLARQAGIPDGVLNVLTGPGEETGKAIALHPEIHGIFFTGSSEVGKLMLGYSGQSNMKKVALECGGKSAFIVSEKCDQLKTAAQTLARNMFYNQGQICSAPSRLYIQSSVKETFLDELTRELEAYVPSNPFEPSTKVGAIISKEQYARIKRFIRQGIDSGLNVISPGLRQEQSNCSGYYIAPTVFTDVPEQSPLATEEIFGPVLVTTEFETMSEAIQLANSSKYGLAASIWSASLDEALTCAKALAAGIVHINSYGEDDMSVPFGGIKESGLGKDKSLFAFDEYSNLKTTWIKLRTDNKQ